MCGSSGNYSLASPDGRYRAVIFEFDCGATTDFGTNLSVLSNTRKFDPFDDDEDQRILVADPNHGAVGVDLNGILPILVEWKDSTHLLVTIPKAARVSYQRTTSGPISIEYISQ
jgi:hypothetical protein